MGPLLWKDNPSLYWPGNPEDAIVPDYYSNERTDADADKRVPLDMKHYKDEPDVKDPSAPVTNTHPAKSKTGFDEVDHRSEDLDRSSAKARQHDLRAVDALPWMHPRRLWATFRMIITYGITRDVIAHQSKGLEDVHARAPQFDNKVEYLWTTAQVCSAMIMSI